MDPLAAHEGLIARLAELLARRAPVLSEAHACPYLAGRTARQAFVLPKPLEPGLYHALMDLNMRRVGPVFYGTACDGCDQCRMLRLPVAEFRPTRAQRRCLARNRDVAITLGMPEPSDEKLALYRRYLAARHDGQMDGSTAEFESFLYSSPLATLELVYRVGGRLLAVGIADREPLALSAVYCYFDPEQERRSPGVLNVLRMIEEARIGGQPFLYLGFHVRGSRAMEYKACYRPCEIRQPDGRWLRHE
ncbi:MAG: arginyltransferase [Vicinamibacteria bacterium]